MFTVQFWIYSIISFICLFGVTACSMAISSDRPSSEQRDMFVITSQFSIFNMGYLCYFMGSSQEILLLGMKLEFEALLSVFVTLFTMMIKSYRIKFVGFLRQAVHLWTAVLIVLLFIANQNVPYRIFHIFIKECNVFVNQRGISLLYIKGGPFYYCYLFTMAIFILLSVGVFIYRFSSTESKSRKENFITFFITFFVQVTCLAFSAFPYKGVRFPFLPILTFVASCVMVVIIKKRKYSNLYDLSLFAVVDTLYNPLFIVDSKMFVREVNIAAKAIYPEYHKASYKIDIALSPELKKIILQPVYSMNPEPLHIAGRTFSPEPHRIERSGVTYGYVLVLNDITEQINKNARLENQNIQLSYGFHDIENQLISSRRKLIGAIIQFAMESDRSLGEHMRRVSDYTAILVRQLQKSGRHSNILTDEYRAALCQVSPLHDCGKIFNSESSARHSYSSPEDAAAHERKHVLLGAQVVERMFVNNPNDLFFRLAREVALYHHEWWDGTGYVRGLKGEEIPLSARIVSLANEFDNFTANRPFMESYSFAEAYTAINSYSGKQFDPEVVDAFKKSRKEFLELYNTASKQKEELSSINIKPSSQIESL